MNNIFPCGFAAVIVSMLLTLGLIVILRPILVRYALARPNDRSSHKIPTPQGGGIAVIASTVGVPCLVAALCGIDIGGYVLAIFGIVLAMAALGGIDDIRPINVLPRLIFQAAVSIIAVLAVPGRPHMASWMPVEAELFLFVIGTIWFINLVNFMDGIDLMTVAEFVPVTLGIVILGTIGGIPFDVIVVALSLCGAMIGFAFFNRPIARVFLGDVGSLPAGLLMAWMLMILAGREMVAAAILLPLYYLADASITLLVRLLKRKRIWEAHRTHFYQRAMDSGASVRDIVLRVFAVNWALVALAVWTVIVPGVASSLLALAVGAALVAWLLAQFGRWNCPSLREARRNNGAGL